MQLLLGPLTSAIAGSIGGTTFQRSGVGTLARSRPLPTTRRTSFTNTGRSLEAYLSRNWRALTEAQQAAWQTAADGITWTNTFGDTIRGLGYWLYIRTNQYLRLTEQSLISTAPAVTPPASITGLSSNRVTGSNTFTVSWTSGNVPAGEVWAVFATKPLSRGKLVPGTAYRYVQRIVAGTATGASIRNAYDTRFGPLPSTSQRCWVRVVPIITTTGINGPYMEVPVTIT